MATTYDKASLVMIPSGVKESKLYSIKPTDGSGDFTFSRGTDTATRVNSSGLIEKERGNLILQSNSFDTTWNNTRSTETSGQSGYDGTNDAWLLESTATAQSARVFQSITKSYVHTMSVYAKAGTSSWVALLTDGNQQAYFDLANGLVGLTSGADVIDSNIEAVGATGWYRCSATFNGNDTFSIFIANGDGDATTDSGDSIYIQDAMLNEGLVAQPYIETTTAAVYEGITDNLPRLDYSGGASCPSLLLEPSRTNGVPHSEYFGGWLTFNSSIVNNDATSPEGLVNAAKLKEDSSTSFHDTDINFTFGAATNTFSVFAKAAERSVIFLQQFDGSTFHSSNNFDLSAGTYGGGSEGKIEDYGNGWYRCSFTATTTTGTGKLYINLHNGTSGNYAGDGTSGVHIYGAQLEASASYPTSYIPTYGTSASRAGDVCIDAGDSSTFNDSEGVLYAELSAFEGANEDRQISISDGSNSNRIGFQLLANGTQIQFYAESGGSGQLNSIQTIDATNGIKIAISYKVNDFKVYVNGSLTATDTSGATPIGLNELAFDRGTGGDIFYGNVKQVLTFNTALTNAELAALTTL